MAKLTTNMNRIIDVMAVTTAKASTNIVDLFEAFKDGAPAMTEAGQSLETTATLAGLMANAGIDATRAGTGLKNIALSMANINSGSGKMLEKLLSKKRKICFR